MFRNYYKGEPVKSSTINGWRLPNRDRVLQLFVVLLCLGLWACQSWFGGKSSSTADRPAKAQRSIEELRQAVIDNPDDADDFADLAKAMPLHLEIRLNQVRAELEAAESTDQLKQIQTKLDEETHHFAEGLSFVQHRCRCSEKDFKEAYDDFLEQMGYKNNMIEVTRNDIEVKRHKFQKNSLQHGENAVVAYRGNSLEEAHNQAILALQYDDTNARANVILAKTKLYFEGENLVAAHRIEAAIKHFEKILKICQKNPDVILSTYAAKQLPELRAKRRAVNRMLLRADRLFKAQRFEKAREKYKSTLQRNQEYSEIIERRLKALQFSEMAKVQERSKSWNEALVNYTKVKELQPEMTFVDKWIKKVRYNQDLTDAREALKLAKQSFSAGQLDASVNLLKKSIQRYPDRKKRKKETRTLVRNISKQLEKQASKEKNTLVAWRLYGLCAGLGGSRCSGKFTRLDRKIKPKLLAALGSDNANWASRLTAASLLLEVDSENKKAAQIREETLGYPEKHLDFSFPTSFELVGYSAYGDLPDNAVVNLWRELFVEVLVQNGLKSVPGAKPLKVQVQVTDKPAGPPAFAEEITERGVLPGKEKVTPPGLLFLVGPADGTVIDAFWMPYPADGTGWLAAAVPSVQNMGTNVVNWVRTVEPKSGRETAIRASMRRWRLTNEGPWAEAPFELFWQESQI